MAKQKRRFRRIAIGTGIFLFIGIVGFVVWLLFRPVEAKDPQLTSPTPIPGAELYNVQNQGSQMIFTINSSFGEQRGTIGISGEKFEFINQGEGLLLRADLTIDAQSVQMETEVLTGLMRTAFKAEEYPEGRFIGQAADLIPNIESLSEPTQIDLVGQLELGGTVLPRTIPIELRLIDERLVATSQTSMDASQYVDDFPPGVEPEMPVEIKVNALYNGAVPISQLYTIKQESELAFVMNTAIGEIDGTFDITGERVELIPVEVGDGWRMVAYLTIDGKSAETGQPVMNQLIVEAFAGRKYTGVFRGVSKEIIESLQGKQQVTLDGNLELKGNIRSFSIPVEFEVNDGKLDAVARTTLDVAEFGVELPPAVQSSVMDVEIRVTATQNEITNR
jgi:polyisoprenoid-binding protein YceI